MVLAEDSPLFREGIARILGSAGFEVLAQVGDHDALIAAVAHLACCQPPVFLLVRGSDLLAEPQRIEEDDAVA